MGGSHALAFFFPILRCAFRFRRARLAKWAILSLMGASVIYLIAFNGRGVILEPRQSNPHSRSIQGIFNQFLRPASSVRPDGPSADSEPPFVSYTTAEQKMLVVDAMKRVRHAASADPTVRKVADTKADLDQEDREKALMAMMGIRHGVEDSDVAPVRVWSRTAPLQPCANHL
jgi:hypothetical protein